jgi:hypothetical protein
MINLGFRIPTKEYPLDNKVRVLEVLQGIKLLEIVMLLKIAQEGMIP